MPDEPFLAALRTATRRDVEVRLIVSLHGNQTLTQFAQRSYYEELLTAGVRVHLYRPHFLHAKHLSVDDSIALLGSTNIDIRSFALNAEVSLILYDRDAVQRLREVQERCIADSDELDLTAWQQRPRLPARPPNLARLADSVLCEECQEPGAESQVAPPSGPRGRASSTWLLALGTFPPNLRWC